MTLCQRSTEPPRRKSFSTSARPTRITPSWARRVAPPATRTQNIAGLSIRWTAPPISSAASRTLDPVRREEFVASRGRGAQLNGRRIRVSKRTDLETALIGTGIPFLERQEAYLPSYTEVLKTLAGSSAGIRRAGAASLDLAYVAAGRLDAFWEPGLSAWDIAAGSLLIREAGGLLSDFNGDAGYMESGNIVCGNPKCFKAVLQVVKPAMGHIAADAKAS